MSRAVIHNIVTLFVIHNVMHTCNAKLWPLSFLIPWLWPFVIYNPIQLHEHSWLNSFAKNEMFRNFFHSSQNPPVVYNHIQIYWSDHKGQKSLNYPQSVKVINCLQDDKIIHLIKISQELDLWLMSLFWKVFTNNSFLHFGWIVYCT